jgi:hypothetical protein
MASWNITPSDLMEKNINVGGLHFNVKELNVLVQSLEVSTEERSKGRLCVMRERERERERGGGEKI